MNRQLKYIRYENAHDVDNILSFTSESKRVFLFSATMKKKMVALIDKHMPDYDSVEVEAKFLTTDLVEQVYLEVNESQKFEALCRFVDLEVDFYGFVIFQIECFSCTEIEPKKTFWANARIIPCSQFYDMYGDEHMN